MAFDLHAHTILLTVSGSRAYGMHTPQSDVDVRGVAIPPAASLLGIGRDFEQADSVAEIAAFAPDLSADERAVVAHTKLEGSVYGLRKLARLATDCNPNILDVLFCRDAEVRLVTPLGQRLRDHRDLFLSARARHSYAGYAAAQLKRIKGHRAWLLNPPEREPSRADFGLPGHTLIPRDQLAAAEAAVRRQVDSWEIDYGDLPGSQIVALQARIAATLAEQGVGTDQLWATAARHVGLDDNLIHVMQQERAYKAAHRHFSQYQAWKHNRNPARAALEARHGYDTKHGAHLVRLLRMGREILATGEVHVWRGDRDAQELLAIRAGAWSYEQLVEHADSEMARLAELDRQGPIAVPRSCDRDAIDALVVQLVGEAIGLG